MEKFQLTKHFRYPWPVNVSPLYCIFLLFISIVGQFVNLGCKCIDDMGTKFYMLHIISHDMHADHVYLQRGAMDCNLIFSILFGSWIEICTLNISI